MKARDLIDLLLECPADAEVVVRTLEEGEVSLTVSATEVKIEPCQIVILGDLDAATIGDRIRSITNECRDMTDMGAA